MTKKGGWQPTGFGAKLRKIRKAKALTQKDLGKAVGISSNGIALLERGVTEPAFAVVIALARFLEVSCDDLQRKPGEPEEPPEEEEKPKRGRPPTKAPAAEAPKPEPPEPTPPKKKPKKK